MDKNVASVLVPIDQDAFWARIRAIVREEVERLTAKAVEPARYETPGLTYKPLFKIIEVCKLFGVTRPTIYDWIQKGRLKPYKIGARVYFLWNDIQVLLGASRG